MGLKQARVIGIESRFLVSPNMEFIKILENNFGDVLIVSNGEWDVASASYASLVTYRGENRMDDSFQAFDVGGPNQGNKYFPIIHSPLTSISMSTSFGYQPPHLFHHQVMQSPLFPHRSVGENVLLTPKSIGYNEQSSLGNKESLPTLTPWSCNYGESTRKQSWPKDHHGFTLHRPSRSDTSWLSVESEKSSQSTQSHGWTVPDSQSTLLDTAAIENDFRIHTPLWLRAKSNDFTKPFSYMSSPAHSVLSLPSLSKTCSEPRLLSASRNCWEQSPHEPNALHFAGRNEMSHPTYVPKTQIPDSRIKSESYLSTSLQANSDAVLHHQGEGRQLTVAANISSVPPTESNQESKSSNLSKMWNHVWRLGKSHRVSPLLKPTDLANGHTQLESDSISNDFCPPSPPVTCSTQSRPCKIHPSHDKKDEECDQEDWKVRCRPYLKNMSMDKLLAGQENRTTVMIRNIPNKYTQDMFKSFLDNDLDLFGHYDFLYLRMDFINKCNVGYAFVNFVDTHKVIDFISKAVGKKWPMFKSEKVCSMSFAAIQGTADLIERFRNSSVMLEPEPYRPKLFSVVRSSPHYGMEVPFPQPTESGYRPKSDVLFSRTHAAAGPF